MAKAPLSIESRIDRIQRELYVWRAVGLSVVTAVFLIAAGSPSDELRTRKLIVGDELHGVVIDATESISSIYITHGLGANILLGASKDGEARIEVDGGAGSAHLSVDDKFADLLLLGSNDSTANMTAGVGVVVSTGKYRTTLTPYELNLIGEDKSIINLDVRSGPAIQLFDGMGYGAALGTVALEDKVTGKTSRTSAASLRLFGKDSKTLWSAP